MKVLACCLTARRIFFSAANLDSGFVRALSICEISGGVCGRSGGCTLGVGVGFGRGARVLDACAAPCGWRFRRSSVSMNNLQNNSRVAAPQEARPLIYRLYRVSRIHGIRELGRSSGLADSRHSILRANEAA